MNCSTRQFLAFSIVGVINTVVHFAVFMLFLRLFQVPLLIASTIGYCAGIVNSYCINRLWTFKVRSRATVQEFLRFTTVNLLSLGANLVLLSYLNTAIGLGPEFAQIGAIGGSLLVNFAGNKWWTFRTP